MVVEKKSAAPYEKEKMLKNAVAIVEMEGFKFSEKDKEICMKLFDGRISNDALAKALKKISDERVLKSNAV